MMRILFLMLSLNCLFYANSGFAEVKIFASKLSINNAVGEISIENLKNEVNAADDSTLAVCSEVQEVENAFICAFKSIESMNASLTRIGFYTGTANGFPKGTFIADDDPKLAEYRKIIKGHNFTDEDAKFYSAFSSDQQANLNNLEQDFFNNFLKTENIQSRQKFSVIAFSPESEDYQTTIKHEIFHARYYLQPVYKSIVWQFWLNNFNGQTKVRKILGKFYNAEDDNIIVDEFQAYLLESQSESNIMAEFADPYRKALIWLLGKYGISIE